MGEEKLPIKDFLGFVEWAGKKRTKDTILCYGVILLCGYLGLGPEYLAAIATIGGIKIVGQSVSDKAKAK